MPKHPIAIDEYRRIRGGGIHDAVVCSFRFDKGKSFEICLNGLDDRKRWIYLLNIEGIGFDQVVDGTIISDIFVWEMSDNQHISDDFWRVLLGGNYLQKDLKTIRQKLSMEYPNSKLVLFESSFGGSIAAICREVKSNQVAMNGHFRRG